MKIYTKSGDKGKTSLLSGERVEKYDIRINAYGTIDELNSFVGLLIASDINKNYKEFLLKIQNDLYNAGALLAVRKDVKFDLPKINEEDIIITEKEIDTLTKELPPLKEFILPGGNEASSRAHICRSICRRAERLAVELSQKEQIDERLIIYLNRLSDYFFVLARKILQDENIPETVWKP